jgi:hypothetical protein
MRKIIITYGLISGAIVAGLMFATMPFWKSGVLNFNNGEAVGYTTMVIALSLIFFGIKSCRDNFYQGTITFGQGVKVGLLITLIAAVMYALAWEVCYNTVATDFVDKMSEHYISEAKTKAASPAEVEAAIAEMESFKQWYSNPFLRFGITLTEILPVGVIITLISSMLLRNKQILPALQNSR